MEESFISLESHPFGKTRSKTSVQSLLSMLESGPVQYQARTHMAMGNVG